MIITENIKKEFFDKIVGKHLLLIVSSGVDSVCTFRIIKHILRNYNISFSYNIIKTKNELRAAYTNYDQFDDVLLINYGAIIDIIEFLEIDQMSKRTVYIIDSQRPIHINNFYNQIQVKLITFKESFDYVPDYDDVFKDDEEEIDDEELVAQNHEWEKKREDILSQYEMYCFHGTTSSLVAYYMGDCMNQYNYELLWNAAVGHMSQYILNLINRKSYCEYLDFINTHISRINLSKKFKNIKNKEEMFIEENEELNLWLYRHWSLEEALHVTPVTLTTFKLCRMKGLNKLNEFLAFLGIPQEEYKNPFSTMKSAYKSTTYSLVKEHYQTFNLSKEELFLPSYTASCGYRTSISAIDATFIVVGILEDINKHGDYADRFARAMNTLSMNNDDEIERGLTLAVSFLKSIHKQATHSIENNDIHPYGSFLHIELKKNCPIILRSALVQNILNRYLLKCSFSIRPKLGIYKKADKCPMILCSEINEDQLVLYGIPPLVSGPGKNLLGKVFETVLTNLNYQVEQDSLDTCRVTIHPSDKMRIFDRISQLLSP